MAFEDKLGPAENQSPRHKNHPTVGANLSIPEAELEADCIGGNKHTATGGSSDEFHDAQDSVTRGARASEGIQSPRPPTDEDFSEGSGFNDRDQGATLTRGSID